MSNFDAEGSAENNWDEQGDLAWNEFDWEKYLQEQDAVIKNYLSHYERLKEHTERIDEVAHLMGWDHDTWTSEDDGTSEPETAVDEDIAESELDPYTFHKNPIFISTKALCLSLKTAWEKSRLKVGAFPKLWPSISFRPCNGAKSMPCSPSSRSTWAITPWA